MVYRCIRIAQSRVRFSIGPPTFIPDKQCEGTVFSPCSPRSRRAAGKSPAPLGSPSLASGWAPPRCSACWPRIAPAFDSGQTVRRHCFQPLLTSFASGCRESNPVYTHPMGAYYRYTTARFATLCRAAGNRTRSTRTRSVRTTGILRPDKGLHLCSAPEYYHQSPLIQFRRRDFANAKGLVWAVQDSNLWPLPCEGNALPTELTARMIERSKRVLPGNSFRSRERAT